MTARSDGLDRPLTITGLNHLRKMELNEILTALSCVKCTLSNSSPTRDPGRSRSAQNSDEVIGRGAGHILSSWTRYKRSPSVRVRHTGTGQHLVPCLTGLKAPSLSSFTGVKSEKLEQVKRGRAPLSRVVCTPSGRSAIR